MDANQQQLIKEHMQGLDYQNLEFYSISYNSWKKYHILVIIKVQKIGPSIKQIRKRKDSILDGRDGLYMIVYLLKMNN